MIAGRQVRPVERRDHDPDLGQADVELAHDRLCRHGDGDPVEIVHDDADTQQCPDTPPDATNLS
jgi:hypothetical protein